MSTPRDFGDPWIRLVDGAPRCGRCGAVGLVRTSGDLAEITEEWWSFRQVHSRCTPCPAKTDAELAADLVREETGHLKRPGLVQWSYHVTALRSGAVVVEFDDGNRHEINRRVQAGVRHAADTTEGKSALAILAGLFETAKYGR